MVDSLLARRIAEFDFHAAAMTAELAADRRQQGRPIDLRDAMIAGIAMERRSSLATHNVKHFEQLPITVVDPWSTAA